MTHRFIRDLGAPDFDDIKCFQTDPVREPGPVVTVVMLTILAVLFVLTMIAVSIGQARSDRPSFCTPYPSIAECMAAAQETRP